MNMVYVQLTSFMGPLFPDIGFSTFILGDVLSSFSIHNYNLDKNCLDGNHDLAKGSSWASAPFILAKSPLF